MLSRLDDDERVVVEAYAQGDPDTSWGLAAIMSGLDVRFGSRGQRRKSGGWSYTRIGGGPAFQVAIKCEESRGGC